MNNQDFDECVVSLQNILKDTESIFKNIDKKDISELENIKKSLEKISKLVNGDVENEQ